MEVEILKTWSRYNFGFPSRPNFTLKNTKSNTLASQLNKLYAAIKNSKMNTHIFAPSHAHVRQFFWKIFRKRLMLFLKRQTCTSGLDKEGQCLRNKEKTKKSKIIKNTPSRNECFSVYFNYIMTVFLV